jgi:hypothetical protein
MKSLDAWNNETEIVFAKKGHKVSLLKKIAIQYLNIRIKTISMTQPYVIIGMTGKIHFDNYFDSRPWSRQWS